MDYAYLQSIGGFHIKDGWFFCTTVMAAAHIYLQAPRGHMMDTGLEGTIRDCRLWHRALSGCEVSAQFHAKGEVQ